MSPPGENRGHEPKESILRWNLMSAFAAAANACTALFGPVPSQIGDVEPLTSADVVGRSHQALKEYQADACTHHAVTQLRWADDIRCRSDRRIPAKSAAARHQQGTEPVRSGHEGDGLPHEDFAARSSQSTGLKRALPQVQE
jgi:hypothetical protein